MASGQDDVREDDVERIPMMPLGSGVGDGYGPQWDGVAWESDLAGAPPCSRPRGGTMIGVTLDPIANDDGLDPDQLADRLSDAFATYDADAGTAWQAVWDDLADIHGVDR